MHISQIRMQKLPELLKSAGAINDRQEFLQAIGIQEAERHFTAEHIRLACNTYHLNANWILGLERKAWRNRIS